MSVIDDNEQYEFDDRDDDECFTNEEDDYVYKQVNLEERDEQPVSEPVEDLYFRKVAEKKVIYTEEEEEEILEVKEKCNCFCMEEESYL